MADLFSRFVLNPATGAANPSRKQPKEILLSSQYVIRFQIGTYFYDFADIDNVSKTLRIDEKKNFKPYGYSHRLVLTSHSGWDIRITGKKPNDGALEKMIDAIIELNNDPNTIYPQQNKPYGANPTIELTVLVIDDITSTGISTSESYIYKDLVLTSFDEDVPDDNSPVTFNMTFLAKNRIAVNYGKDEKYDNLISGMLYSTEKNASNEYKGPATRKPKNS